MLPVELYHTIARCGTYREMLSIPAFARSLTVNSRLDYMTAIGYNVVITHPRIFWILYSENSRADPIKYGDGIVWWDNDKVHQIDGPAIELPDESE